MKAGLPVIAWPPHFPAGRKVALWGGAALILLAVVVAVIAFRSARVAQPEVARGAERDIEAEAGELRAKGAIVENYYQVIGDRYPAVQPMPSAAAGHGYYPAAGVLAAAGVVLVCVGLWVPRKVAVG